MEGRGVRDREGERGKGRKGRRRGVDERTHKNAGLKAAKWK